MNSLTIWHIEPDSDDGIVVSNKHSDNRPTFLYLDGSKGFTNDSAKKNLNQTLRSFLQGIIAPSDYHLYIPTLNSSNQSTELRNYESHAKELVDFLMPEIPATLPLLKLFFSKLTVVGYSHGTEETLVLINQFRKKLENSRQFSKAETNEAMSCLGIITIGKGRKYNLPEYAPVPTYTVVSGQDRTAFPLRCAREPSEHESTETWDWKTHSAITHAMHNNHVVVIDDTNSGNLQAIKLEPQSDDAIKFSSRLERRPHSDWKMVDVSKFVGDAHHLYLYTNTDARFIPDKATQVFQSMATAPMTVGLIGSLIQASVRATLDKPRNSIAILDTLVNTQLSPLGKESLRSQLIASNRNYNAIIGRA